MGPGDNERDRLGLAVAILLSALAHVGLLFTGLVLIPRWLAEQPAPPPVYTVAVVDNLPAGDLGTHLPRLNPPQHTAPAPPPKKTAPPPKPPKTAKATAPNSDIKAFALNKRGNLTPTPTPTPAQATAAPTAPPTPRPTARPTARPTHRATTRPTPTARRLRATPKPTQRAKRPRPTATPRERHAAPRETPKRMLAQATPQPTPGVRERLAELRKQLLKDSLKHRKAIAEKHEGEEGGGPVESHVATGGHGYGVGPGSGSAGILKDPAFLVYYSQLQERIKKAWTFSGGNSDLTTTIEFAIGPDGQLLNYQVQRSSRDSAYDDSVVRAIKRAAPFPPPPPDYRDEFSRGIQATFKLGELNS